MGMNNAQLTGIRNLHFSTVTIQKVGETYEVRQGDALLGCTVTYAGAQELASVVQPTRRNAQSPKRTIAMFR